MGFMKWRNSSNCRETIYLGKNPSEAKPRWQAIWKKIYREKKSSNVSFQASYDPDEYLQNFDQGTDWTQPESLTKSFSARFADPSKILMSRTSSVRCVQGV